MPLYRFDLYKYNRFFDETKRHGKPFFGCFLLLLFFPYAFSRVLLFDGVWSNFDQTRINLFF